MDRARKLVVIGDLNGADDVLIDMLQGMKLIDEDLRWVGGRSELVQMGDLFNRGGGALRAFRLLLDLRRQARDVGGDVTVLLGNHEAMTALRHEGYCTEAEYLAFASAKDRRAWPSRVSRALRRIVRDHTPRGVILPIHPRLEAWKIANVPGRAELRRALAPRGKLGRELRGLPVVYASGGCVFVHGGLLPRYAKLGVDGLNALARTEWSEAPSCLWMLPKKSLFRNPDGPLWDRSLVEESRKARLALRRSLELLGVRRMVVGHTQTSSLPGGREGEVCLLAGGRLVAVDVGLRSGKHTPRAALIVRGAAGFEWTPRGTRQLWDDESAPPL